MTNEWFKMMKNCDDKLKNVESEKLKNANLRQKLRNFQSNFT